MKKAFFGVWIFLFSLSLHAQHCGFDFAYLLTIDIRDPKTGKNIPNLEVQLADSMGKRYPKDQIKNCRYYQDLYFGADTTLRLVQNTLPENLSFLSSFVENSYFIIVQGNNLGIRKKGWEGTILIKDHNGTENLGKFREKTIRIQTQNFVRLCGTYYKKEDFWEELKVNKLKIFLEN